LTTILITKSERISSTISKRRSYAGECRAGNGFDIERTDVPMCFKPRSWLGARGGPTMAHDTSGVRLAILVFTLALVIPSIGEHQQPCTQRLYVGLYERGPAWIEGRSMREFPNFQQHVAHIRAIDSRLLGAGPFEGKPREITVRMIVFSAATDEDAQRLAESDPFVVAKYTRVSKVLRWQVDKLKGCS
jgi:uncharacterized protein YciI